MESKKPPPNTSCKRVAELRRFGGVSQVPGFSSSRTPPCGRNKLSTARWEMTLWLSATLHARLRTFPPCGLGAAGGTGRGRGRAQLRLRGAGRSARGCVGPVSADPGTRVGASTPQRDRRSEGRCSVPRALDCGPAEQREFSHWGLEEGPLPLLGSCDAKCRPESAGEGTGGFVGAHQKAI